MKAYLKLLNGEKQYFHVKIIREEIEGVSAVFIEGFSNSILDGDLGAVIEFKVDDVKSWMADYRYSEYWCCPEFGSRLEDIPNETQGLIYEKYNGTFGVVLPVVSEQYKCVLSGGKNERIHANLFSWYEKLTTCKALAFLWAEGENPYMLMEKCAQVGLKLLNTGCRTRKERRYPEIFEYLGWCSWDAFEIRVDEESLLAKCQEFKGKEIPVKWTILDDMWAEVRDFYDIEYKDRSEMFRLMHSSKLY